MFTNYHNLGGFNISHDNHTNIVWKVKKQNEIMNAFDWKKYLDLPFFSGEFVPIAT